jgi:hypothetical protein
MTPKVIQDSSTSAKKQNCIILKCGDINNLSMLNYITKLLPVPLVSRAVVCHRLVYCLHSPQGTRRLDLYQKIKGKERRAIQDNQLNK